MSKDSSSATSRYSKVVLAALQGQRHIYAGTVPHAEVQRRRAKNKRAAQSRRASRQASR